MTWSLDFTYENNTFTNIASGAYNYTTDKFYACDYDDAAEMVAILNADGTESGSALDTTGLTLGSLNVFSICVAEDGVIYGASNEETTGGPQQLLTWANEAATPSEQDVTDMQFVRVMDVKGTGTDTKIFVGGQDDAGDVDILATTDGSTFTLDDTTIAGIGKHGMAVSADGLAVFMGQGYLGNVPIRADNNGGTWELSATFLPVDGDVYAPCPMDYWADRDILFCLETRQPDDNDRLLALNGSTGAVLNNIALGINASTYGYGTIDIDPATDADGGQAFFIARATDGYYCGSFQFAWEIPTSASNWGLYE